MAKEEDRSLRIINLLKTHFLDLPNSQRACPVLGIDEINLDDSDLSPHLVPGADGLAAGEIGTCLRKAASP